MKTKSAKPIWTEVPCRTCGAEKDGGCFVMGRDTLMRHRYKPHATRVRDAAKHAEDSSEARPEGGK